MSALLNAHGVAIRGRLVPTSLEVEPGQLIGLIGPNGSGKTSLLHALAGIPPATGSVVIGGVNLRGLHPDRKQRLCTFLPASRNVRWPLTGRAFIDLALPPGVNGIPVADRLELAAMLDRRMDQLSTGERTRVMIARALAPDPQLLLLDEPIANLDPYWQLAILKELTARARQDGKTVIAAIHDLRTALDWSDRLLLMDDQRCVADGPPAKVVAAGQIEKVFSVALDAAGNVRQLADPQSWP